MTMDDNWSNLPPEILIEIVQRLCYFDYYLRFIAVCKSWRDSVGIYETPCLLPLRYPFLLLAEEVAPGTFCSDREYDSNIDYGDTTDEENSDDSEEEDNVGEGVEAGEEEDIDDDEEEDSSDDDDGEEDEDDSGDDDEEDIDSNVDYGDTTDEEDSDDSEEEDNVGEGVEAGEEEDIDDDEDSGDDDDDEEDSDDDDSGDDDDNDNDEEEDEDDRYDHTKNSVGSSRGLYSLLTGKTYIIDLPEAAGRLILGTNKGWLVTLGRDLQINLLHPLLRYQISLPPMLTFPQQYEDYLPEEASDMFIEKLAISSIVLNKNTAASLYHYNATPTPIVMAIYGEQRRYLGFARLGDKKWTDVNVPSQTFTDIAYHNGNFYAVDCHGGIFVCGIDDDEERGGIRGTKITSFETNDWDQKYLVESGSGLLLLVRKCKFKQLCKCKPSRLKYRTTDFSVWRLDLKYSDSLENISCNLKEENDLGNEAIFVGISTSTAVSSSEIIKPNCIYFTDNNSELYYHDGGGHDMGIFSMEHHTIEPHFQGKSIHPISPPLWYI